MFEIEEEGPSESKGQPRLKRQKTEEEGADTTEEEASVEKAVSSIDVDVDVDSEREKTIQRIVKSCKDCGASENVINHIISELRKPRDDSDNDSERADPVLWEQYRKQVEDTEGFGVTIDLDDDDVMYRPVLNLKESNPHMRIATELCNLAIEDYNKNNVEEGKEFKVVNIEWVVTQLVCGILYLLTFKAAAEEVVKTFEAEVLYGGGEGKNIVYFCRIKKETNKCIV